MKKNGPHILIAGGGTGGHLFPALAIADTIRDLRPNAEFLFLGTKGKIEARVVPERGYALQIIWISGFQRRLTLDNLLFPLKVLVSLVQSFFLIRRFRPDVVVGTGGYVCGPVLFVASVLKIPTVIHEQNSYPGVTTRLLAQRVTKVFVAFDAAKSWLKRTDHVVLTGTPTRDALGNVSRSEGQAFFHLNPGKKTVLVSGGSLGAASINNAVLDSLDALHGSDIQLIWQTGHSDFARVQAATGGKVSGWVGAFIEKMEYAFAAADLIVCRSGATTLAELTRIGKPAVLVPYPQATADHQTHNARSLVDAGAAVMIADRDARANLGSVVVELMKAPGRLEAMGKASAKLGKPEAAPEIAAAILNMVR